MESTHWFSRYEKHMPETGEIVLIDLGTRALTEITMNYCTKTVQKFYEKSDSMGEGAFGQWNRNCEDISIG